MLLSILIVHSFFFKLAWYLSDHITHQLLQWSNEISEMVTCYYFDEDLIEQMNSLFDKIMILQKMFCNVKQILRRIAITVIRICIYVCMYVCMFVLFINVYKPAKYPEESAITITIYIKRREKHIRNHTPQEKRPKPRVAMNTISITRYSKTRRNKKIWKYVPQYVKACATTKPCKNQTSRQKLSKAFAKVRAAIKTFSFGPLKKLSKAFVAMKTSWTKYQHRCNTIKSNWKQPV